uniref:siderophore-interacting protein n=1 Tax=Pseudactinotalea suaedae TaxID=1524924 RepID=UPI001F4FF7DC|nr:siderophore-interacting protein [Pseudactinotalea suaedae]
MRRKKNTPTDRQFTMAHVRRVERISPSFVRLTLGGMDELAPRGHDHWCRLFFARDGQDTLQLPTRTGEVGWYLQYLATPRARRPWVRAYTCRDVRPDTGEVDIDFVIHEDEAGRLGPAAQFALAASPGDRLGFLDQGIGFTPDHPHDWTLLVGDETALPAVAGIIASLPQDARGMAIIEVPTSGDRQEIRAPLGLEVRWIHRNESSAGGGPPGQLALEAVKATVPLRGVVHAHLIGESALATGARRHLVQEWGVPKRNVDFVGYWRHGRPATT